MSVDLSFTVEDITTKLLSYNQIKVYRSDTAGGAFSALGTVTLVAGTYLYTYTDSTGDLNKYYTYTFYNSGSAAESAQSAPFRPEGTTRKRVRQYLLEKYGLGKVLTASAGNASSVSTTDYRVSNTLFSASRGKGTWILPTTGAEAGNARMVTALTSAGVFSVNPNWATGMSASDEFEWHTVFDPYDNNLAINRGFNRQFYVDRIPIASASFADGEFSLEDLSWLSDPRHVHDLRYYPTDGATEAPYGTQGRWWGIRKDEGRLVLQVSPEPDDVVYLYVSRPLPALYTDNSSPPPDCNEEYAAALAYDEILKVLSSPRNGTTQEVLSWKQTRVDFVRSELRSLSYANKLALPKALPQLPSPPTVPLPYSER